MKDWWCTLKMFLWMMVLTGIVYPLIITGIAQLTMKHRADGSFITSKDTTVGSRLIGQKFTSERYFWPRPSAVDYNPLPSGGSNLGPTSAALKKAVEDRAIAIAKAHNLDDHGSIPSELLFASGSGLDPHISVEAVHFQLDRVSRARGWNESKQSEVKKLVDHLTENKWFFLGGPYINVLQLNKALDELDEKK